MGKEIEGISPEEMALVEADRTGADIPETPAEVAEDHEAAQPETAIEEVKTETVKPPEGFVPHGALHEERAKRKEIQKQFQDLNEKYARADERLKFLSESQTKTPDPSFDEDPLGYSKAELDRLKQVSAQYPTQLDELKGEVQSLRLQRNIEKMETAFERTTPDYKQALEFYIKTRSETVKELGYEDQEAIDLINTEMTSVVNRAMETGKNPAELVYKMASRAGYKSQSKDTGKMETLKKAEAASRSLSDSGGRAKGELTAEALAEMSDEDFTKISDEQFRKAMGG